MVPNPLALIAEVTHRCPLHCVYCSNPVQLAGMYSELSTAEWLSIFQQAGKLGMLHAHLTGGEPLARTDLTELIAAARASGLYTNLITSGIGLSTQRLKALVDVGLDHIQLSFQDSREDSANWIAGAKAHAHKIELAHLIRQPGQMRVGGNGLVFRFQNVLYHLVGIARVGNRLRGCGRSAPQRGYLIRQVFGVPHSRSTGKGG